MAEKLPAHNHESQNSNHEIDSEAAERSRQNIEQIKKLAESEKEVSREKVEELREKVEVESTAAEQVAVETQENKPQPDFDQGTLKRNTYKKTMRHVQSQLPTFERAFSKVIHQKTIETVSNGAGKTLARPSGVLGGGVFALIGSLCVLYFARHYGFEYNYGLFIFLYGLGFCVGLFLELLSKKIKR